MKMTYFNNIKHQYNRVIFEFTDEEKQAAGFLKTSKEPAILDIIRLIDRIAHDQIEVDEEVSPARLAEAKKAVKELQADIINIWLDEDETKDGE